MFKVNILQTDTMGLKYLEKVLFLMKDNHALKGVIGTLSEEEFLNLMVGCSEERLETLIWLVTHLHEEYKILFQKSPNVQIDLAKKLHDLEFVKKKPDTLPFVEGKLPVEDQWLILHRMFRAVYWILLEEKPETENIEDGSLNSEQRKQNQRSERNFVIGKKYKPFDVDKAKERLKECQSLVETLKASRREKSLGGAPVQPVEDPEPLAAGVMEDLAQLSRGFQQLCKDLKLNSSPLREISKSEAAELSDAVGKFHSAIVDFENGTKEKSSFNNIEENFEEHLKKSRKKLLDLAAWKKSSTIFNLNNFYRSHLN